MARGGLAIVEMSGPLSHHDISDLRTRFGLRLDAYVPEDAYLERLEVERRDDLLLDARVLAVRPYAASAKIARSLKRAGGNAPGQPAGIRPTAPVRATLFDDADPADFVHALEALQVSNVQVLDDRPGGGRLRVLFATDDDIFGELAQHPDLALVEAPGTVVVDGGPQDHVGGAWNDVAVLWDHGLHGENQVIGLLDEGPPDSGHCFFVDPGSRLPGPSHRKLIAVRNRTGTAPTKHATFVAGCAAGDDLGRPGTNPRRGVAWAARLVSGNDRDLRTANGTGERPTSSLFAELLAAANVGAFIHSNSWHHDSGAPAAYTQECADVDLFMFAHEEHLILGSAGNRGEQQGPPGAAKNAVSVAAAAVDGTGTHFGNGAPGPTADGRQKPDLMAPGCKVESALVGTGCGAGMFGILARCASSFATPRAAGLAGLIRQYFIEGWHPSGTPRAVDAMTPTGALLKAMLINATAPATANPQRPSPRTGWGVLRPEHALAFAEDPRTLHVFDVRHADGPTAGEGRTHPFTVPDGTAELRVTLVWTDPAPAPVDSTMSMVNRLRLVVIDPDGTRQAGEERMDPLASLVLTAPKPGQWRAEVRAERVRVGRPGQGYALVALSD